MKDSRDGCPGTIYEIDPLPTGKERILMLERDKRDMFKIIHELQSRLEKAEKVIDLVDVPDHERKSGSILDMPTHHLLKLRRAKRKYYEEYPKEKDYNIPPEAF